MQDYHLILTGFMGTGKSTIGRKVAEKLERKFLDTDEEIVRRVGQSVVEIFAHFGESSFRQKEREICDELSSCRENLVVATGGGTIFFFDNLAHLSKKGLLVCLRASLAEISRRLPSCTDRPLLTGDYRYLYERRKPTYDSIEHWVDTSGKTPDFVVQELLTLWQSLKK